MDILPQSMEITDSDIGTANHLPWDYNFYRDFPVKISSFDNIEYSPMFKNHWHEQMQLLFFEQGTASIRCNAVTYQLQQGDVLIINSNEIHYGAQSSRDLLYHLIKPEFSFLASSLPDLCQTNYINPLREGQLCFQNQISNDTVLIQIIQRIISEYKTKQPGFELLIKGDMYHILVHLFRHYQADCMLPAKVRQQKSLQQLCGVLKYIDEHFTENICLSQLALLANLSEQHFCHLFRNLTGKTPIDYVNYLRINKAVTLLTENSLNISEIALAVGFEDSNYFSRVFKKYKKVSPTSFKS